MLSASGQLKRGRGRRCKVGQSRRHSLPINHFVGQQLPIDLNAPGISRIGSINHSKGLFYFTYFRHKHKVMLISKTYVYVVVFHLHRIHGYRRAFPIQVFARRQAKGLFM